MNILVSNLNFTATGSQLKNLFSEFGIVRSAAIMRNGLIRVHHTGCIVMSDSADAANALAELDNTLFLQQIIGVRQALLT